MPKKRNIQHQEEEKPVWLLTNEEKLGNYVTWFTCGFTTCAFTTVYFGLEEEWAQVVFFMGGGIAVYALSGICYEKRLSQYRTQQELSRYETDTTAPKNETKPIGQKTPKIPLPRIATWKQAASQQHNKKRIDLSDEKTYLKERERLKTQLKTQVVTMSRRLFTGIANFFWGSNTHMNVKEDSEKKTSLDDKEKEEKTNKKPAIPAKKSKTPNKNKQTKTIAKKPIKKSTEQNTTPLNSNSEIFIKTRNHLIPLPKYAVDSSAIPAEKSKNLNENKEKSKNVCENIENKSHINQSVSPLAGIALDSYNPENKKLAKEEESILKKSQRLQTTNNSNSDSLPDTSNKQLTKVSARTVDVPKVVKEESQKILAAEIKNNDIIINNPKEQRTNNLGLNLSEKKWKKQKEIELKELKEDNNKLREMNAEKDRSLAKKEDSLLALLKFDGILLDNFYRLASQNVTEQAPLNASRYGSFYQPAVSLENKQQINSNTGHTSTSVNRKKYSSTTT